MLRLNLEISEALAARATLVTGSKQRATALRLGAAAARIAAGEHTWPTPDILAWPAWLEREWQRAHADSAPALLRPADEWLLWRDAAGEAAEHFQLLSRDAMADGMRRAAATAAAWRLPRAWLGGAPGSEAQLFAAALTALEARCRALHVLPSHLLAERLIVTPPPARVRFAGLRPLTPIQQLTLERLGQAGADARALTEHGAGTASIELATAQNEEHEVELIAGWCRAQLLADPSRRLLIVLPNLEAAGSAVARALRTVLSPQAVLALRAEETTPLIGVEGGAPLTGYALIAHAFETLALLTGAIDFERLSHWLRAPFTGSLDAAGRARLDAWLRHRSPATLDAALFAQLLQRTVETVFPGAAPLRDSVLNALRELAPPEGSSRAWSQRFFNALKALGFPGTRSLSSPEQQLMERLLALLHEFGEAAVARPVLRAPQALQLLRELAARVAFEPASGDAPVTLTDSTADPVAQYDGIWVSGLAAQAWPEPARPDAYLPVSVQRQAGIPSASPQGQLGLARAALQAWSVSARQLVLSFAQRRGDEQQLGSALLRELAGAREHASDAARISLGAQLRRGALREEFTDERGTPWDASKPLPGGTRALEQQSLCAFRGYAILRLGAEPLEVPERGIGARLRGTLLHRALEKLWAQLGGSAGLAAMEAQMLRSGIERAVRAAAAELLERRADAARRDLIEREIRRALRLIEELCAIERTRAEFHVEALEAARALTIAQARVDLRIDRIDRLGDGSRVIIDYKTGRPRRQDWFGERVAQPQLLAYLQAVEAPVSALATASLAPRAVGFKGIAARGGELPQVHALPGDAQEPAALRWARELTRWRGIVEALVRDFVGGRALLDPTEEACEHCHLQAFCRIGDRPQWLSDARAMLDGSDDDGSGGDD